MPPPPLPEVTPRAGSSGQLYLDIQPVACGPHSVFTCLRKNTSVTQQAQRAMGGGDAQLAAGEVEAGMGRWPEPGEVLCG